jgi:hypothetical protein
MSSGTAACLGLSVIFVVVGWLATMGLVAGALALRTTRRCARCGYGLVMAGPDELEAMLEPGQRAEAELGSVVWQIWHCANCANLERERRLVVGAPFERCPDCGFQTKPAEEGSTCRFCGAS